MSEHRKLFFSKNVLGKAPSPICLLIFLDKKITESCCNYLYLKKKKTPPLKDIPGRGQPAGNNKATRATKRLPTSPEPVVSPRIKSKIELIKRITHQRFCDR